MPGGSLDGERLHRLAAGLDLLPKSSRAQRKGRDCHLPDADRVDLHGYHRLGLLGSNSRSTRAALPKLQYTPLIFSNHFGRSRSFGFASISCRILRYSRAAAQSRRLLCTSSSVRRCRLSLICSTRWANAGFLDLIMHIGEDGGDGIGNPAAISSRRVLPLIFSMHARPGGRRGHRPLFSGRRPLQDVERLAQPPAQLAARFVPKSAVIREPIPHAARGNVDHHAGQFAAGVVGIESPTEWSS